MEGGALRRRPREMRESLGNKRAEFAPPTWPEDLIRNEIARALDSSSIRAREPRFGGLGAARVRGAQGRRRTFRARVAAHHAALSAGEA